MLNYSQILETEVERVRHQLCNYKLLWVDLGFEGYILCVINKLSVVRWISSEPFAHPSKFNRVTWYPVGWNK